MRRNRFLFSLVCIACVMAIAMESSFVLYDSTIRFKNVRNNYRNIDAVRNSLVDIGNQNIRQSIVHRNTLYILFFNAPSWINLTADSEYIKTNCDFNNCVFTRNHINVSMMSAVVFSTQNGVSKKDTERFHTQRSKHQIWVFFRLEAPTFGNISWYKDPVWRRTMNWSWGYRLDSDIFRPMQVLTTRNVPVYKDYRSIYLRKRKMAAWVVSHCNAPSLRDEYVSKLTQSGVSVDIFGLCAENERKVDGKFILKKINDEYMFYLSFENNICTDYISEKFYRYFSLDTVLVVRGGLSYSKHFDSNAFIDTSVFPTVKSLATYLLNVSRDINLYTEYLKHKDIYDVAKSKTESMRKSECQLCEKLNNKSIYKKIYYSVESYLHNGTCHNPDSIL
ncbi:alpha-(1,3)-fucosyltransferase fut-5-like [Mercenaria mercenaria]|uniref:alpha-(1,3)-fucosyltransferase fut-5-like n=1 Tax=Mercenaria mercenaria TaxID=6596 RepID=UPI00234F285A|nr:alpha-(1,3)-fucosyltransferase fut-5-like [Mercenaria mercenaria]